MGLDLSSSRHSAAMTTGPGIVHPDIQSPGYHQRFTLSLDQLTSSASKNKCDMGLHNQMVDGATFESGGFRFVFGVARHRSLARRRYRIQARVYAGGSAVSRIAQPKLACWFNGISGLVRVW